MMGVQAGHKLITFGRQQQSEASKKLIPRERDKTESQLLKISLTKKAKP